LTRKPYSNPAVEAAVRKLEREWSGAFARLDKYLRRELGKLNRDGQILVRDAFNVDRIYNGILPDLQRQIRDRGFSRVLEAEIGQLSDLAYQILEEADDHGLPKSFTKTTGETVKALFQDAQARVLSEERLVARELEQILRRNMAGDVVWSDMIGQIQRRMGVTQQQAINRAMEAVSSFHTQVRVDAFERRDAKGRITGTAWFLYDGPQDERNRTWCGRFVGSRVTTRLLNAVAAKYGEAWERRSSAPASVSLGGWGCRHQLIPLVDPDTWEQYQIGPRGLSDAEKLAALK
jgi:hypothetical protein